ncbi:MAG: Rieske (2Fe-2S) protein [Thaumarchaeota archaeon]|nr:Rieske (2Fe-2S) protein [Nitrososphaerota archaeon]
MTNPNDMERYPICKSNELVEDTMRKVTIDTVDILVGRRNGKLFACNNSCPHKGASLSKGHFNEDSIVCHMHGYEYNLFTGKLEKMRSWKKEDTWVEQDPEWRKSGDLILYSISEENGTVYVSLK